MFQHITRAGVGDNSIAAPDAQPVDDRASFLLIAAVHHDLFERGDEGLDEAFNHVVTTFDDLFGVSREPMPPAIRWPRTRRPTPQASIEAIMYAVRVRGTAALTESKIRWQLSQCDAAAKSQIRERIGRLKAKGVR